MPRKPQPVPPIYEPEVAADAIVYAAHHDRREIFVGLSTVLVINGNKIAPGLGDRYLARTGYQSQQYDGLVDPNRQNNLWEPVPGDHGAHGDFDRIAHKTSAQLWATTHRGIIALAGATVLGAGVAAKAFSVFKKK